jgi:hypothetical protein
MSDRTRQDKVKAASYFMQRANDAIEAAEAARSDEASAAFYKEAETWLYMAGQCLNPESGIARPDTLQPAPRIAGERRSFGRDD